MTRHDRGQLILVGAVLIAFVVLGLAVAIDTAVFTQTTGTQGTSAAITDGAATVDHFVAAIGTTIQGVNEAERHDTITESDLAPAVETTADQARYTVAERAGATLVMTDMTIATHGARVSQTTASELTDSDGTASWSPIDGTAAGPDTINAIGATRLTLTDGELRVTVANETASQEIIITTDSIQRPDGSTCSVTSTDRVLVDLAAGTVSPGDCRFAPFAGVTDPTQLTFVADDGATTARGTYEIAVNGTVSDDSRFTDSPEDPSLSAAVWAITVSYQYTVEEVTYNATAREVPVYP